MAAVPNMPGPHSGRSFMWANAHFVTPNLLIGGDLHRSLLAALNQVDELAAAGVTHIVDTRSEASDADLVTRRHPHIAYLHDGIDDRGQRVGPEWFDRVTGFATYAISDGGVVLTHCHAGINRGPTAGFATLLALGWDVVDAYAAIRRARPVARVAYAADALSWFHARNGRGVRDIRRDTRRLNDWVKVTGARTGPVPRHMLGDVGPAPATVRDVLAHQSGVVVLASARGVLDWVVDVDFRPVIGLGDVLAVFEDVSSWFAGEVARGGGTDRLVYTVATVVDTASWTVGDVAVHGVDVTAEAATKWEGTVRSTLRGVIASAS